MTIFECFYLIIQKDKSAGRGKTLLAMSDMIHRVHYTVISIFGSVEITHNKMYLCICVKYKLPFFLPKDSDSVGLAWEFGLRIL